MAVMTYLTGDQDEQDKVTCEDDGFFLVNKNANKKGVCVRERRQEKKGEAGKQGFGLARNWRLERTILRTSGRWENHDFKVRRNESNEKGGGGRNKTITYDLSLKIL